MHVLCCCFFFCFFRDFIKFRQYDRQGLEGNVLRFVARLDTSRPIDQDRRFILYYYLSNNTLSIFEPQQKNSGKQSVNQKR